MPQKLKSKLLDSGTYGCVIQPPMYQKSVIYKSIIPYKNKNKTDISKIFKREKTFHRELDLLQTVEKIDPKSTFTAKLKGANAIQSNSIQRDALECLTKNYMKPQEKIYYQIILENGGVRVDRNYLLKYDDFLNKFLVFLKGMTELHSNNLLHLDIKPANVLISNTKISLIDYSLMIEMDKIYDKSNNHMLSAMGYNYYPPELFVSYLLLNSYRNNDVKVLKEIFKKMRKLKYFDQRYLLENPMLRQRYISGVKEFIVDIIKKGEFSNEKIFNNLPQKIDVFSLSMILAALNKRILYTNQREKMFVNKLMILCYEINPYKRTTFQELYELVKKEKEKQKVFAKLKAKLK